MSFPHMGHSSTWEPDLMLHGNPVGAHPPSRGMGSSGAGPRHGPAGPAHASHRPSSAGGQKAGFSKKTSPSSRPTSSTRQASPSRSQGTPSHRPARGTSPARPSSASRGVRRGAASAEAQNQRRGRASATVGPDLLLEGVSAQARTGTSSSSSKPLHKPRTGAGASHFGAEPEGVCRHSPYSDIPAAGSSHWRISPGGFEMMDPLSMPFRDSPGEGSLEASAISPGPSTTGLSPFPTPTGGLTSSQAIPPPPLPPPSSPPPIFGSLSDDAAQKMANRSGAVIDHGEDLEKLLYGDSSAKLTEQKPLIHFGDVMDLLGASFKFASQDGGESAVAADVVHIVQGDPMLQVCIEAFPKLIKALQRIQQHPGGSLSWQAFHKYLVPCMVDGAEPGEQSAAAEVRPAQDGASHASARSDPPALHPQLEEMAQQAVLALRRWLLCQFGSLQEVAEYIRSMDTAPLDTDVTCTAVETFLSHPDVQCGAVEDGSLELIFEYLDPKSRGVLDLQDLLGPLQPGAEGMQEDSPDEAAISGPSSPSEAFREDLREKRPAVVPPIKVPTLSQMEADQKASAAERLHSSDWHMLHLIFYELSHDGCDEVLVGQLVQRILGDARVKGAGLLQRIIDAEPSDQRVTLAQALDYVESQRLQTISWERLRRLVLESAYSHRQTIPELMSKEAPPHTAVQEAGHGEQVKWNPNEHPELANHWMETSLGVDRNELRRVFTTFTHCQRGGPSKSPVRKGDFIRLLNHLKAFRHNQLCEGATSPEATSPKVWGDVILHLTCHDSEQLTWADVLEVIRWQCDLCFDRVPATAMGPGGHRCDRDRPGPAVPNGKAKDRLSHLMQAEGDTPEGDVAAAAGSSGAEAVQAHLTPQDGMRQPVSAAEAMVHLHLERSASSPSHADTSSPVDAVGSLFDKALRPPQADSPRANAAHRFMGGEQDQGHKHPFMDYDSDEDAPKLLEEQTPRDDDGDPAAVARLLEEHRRRCGAPDAATMLRCGPSAAVAAQMRPPSHGIRDPPRGAGSGRSAALRIRIEGSQLGMSAEQLEWALAELLQLDSSSVKLKR